MLAIWGAIAAVSVVMMLLTSVCRFSTERSASGAVIGAEMTPVKTLASARIRVNFMFAKVLERGLMR
jgi:hypothetical protein